MNTAVKKILLIDDEEDLNRLTSRRLNRAGLDVCALTDSTKALTTAQEYKPDLVLLDVKMPGLSGFEVFAAMRQDEFLKHVPIIFFSALQDQFDYCINTLKADGVMGKPFDAAELLALIRRLLPN